MLGIDTIKELWGREVEDVEAEIASWGQCGIRMSS